MSDHGGRLCDDRVGRHSSWRWPWGWYSWVWRIQPIAGCADLGDESADRTAQTPESPLPDEKVSQVPWPSREPDHSDSYRRSDELWFCQGHGPSLRGCFAVEQFCGGRIGFVGGADSDGTAALAVEDMIRMAESHHQHLVLVGMQPTAGRRCWRGWVFCGWSRQGTVMSPDSMRCIMRLVLLHRPAPP